MDGDRRFDIFSPVPQRDTEERIFIRPPIVANVADSDVTTSNFLVWGFGYRVAVDTLIRRGGGRIPVLTISADSRGEKEMLLSAALLAEDRRGSYSWAEIDRIFAVLEPESPSEALMQLVDRGRNVTELLDRYRNLPEAVGRSLSDGFIDIRTAESVPPRILPYWSELCETTAAVSFSERRQIMRLIFDDIRSEKAEPEEVMAVTRRLTGRELLETLRRRRYPTLYRLEERLASFQREITAGTGVTVAYPANYEGDYLHVSFRIRSDRELEKRMKTLRKMEGHVDELVELLFTDH